MVSSLLNAPVSLDDIWELVFGLGDVLGFLRMHLNHIVRQTPKRAKKTLGVPTLIAIFWSFVRLVVFAVSVGELLDDEVVGLDKGVSVNVELGEVVVLGKRLPGTMLLVEVAALAVINEISV